MYFLLIRRVITIRTPSRIGIRKSLGELIENNRMDQTGPCKSGRIIPEFNLMRHHVQIYAQ